ncbi:hypothetical protein [Paenibacillus sp. UNC451MF]|uniref:hypothetical protein n=1 Tax=Paenibacillus sp. UNC451MF TaxID=1449063 RepID=UPI000490499A|nr:hypothetical protein [Paenibacillus sp. UNC451MF]
MSKTEQYTVLIAGATFTGLSLACNYGKKAMVVERTGAVGPEFTSTFCKAKIDRAQRVSERSSALREEAEMRNMIGEDGAIHWPAFVPVLHQLISREQLEVRFLTRIIEVKSQPSGGFEVTLMNAAGLSKVIADRIVDTTSFCDTSWSSSQERLHGKRLCAMIYRPDAPDEPPPHIEEYAIHRGRFCSEWVTCLTVRVEDSWAEARAQLLSIWSNRPEPLFPWQLVTIADAFDVEVDPGTHPIAHGWIWHPSAAYSDPIQAFDVGSRMKLEVTEP